MALFPYQRLAYLFNAIQSETLPQEELAKRFDVSTRTIRTDVTALNDVLISYGANIVYDRGLGYRLKITDSQSFATLPMQKYQSKSIPRTAKERVDALLLKFLMASLPIKLDDIAEEWFVSRGTLQHDMTAVREQLTKYQLTLDTIPRQGIKLSGVEQAIRACITDVLWQQFSTEPERSLNSFKQDILTNIDLTYIGKILQNSVNRFDIRLTNEGRQYLIFNGAVSILRITRGHEIVNFDVEDIDSVIKSAASEISKGFVYFLGSEISSVEEEYLGVQISAQRIPYNQGSVVAESNSDELVDYILSYINDSYNYDLRGDVKLKTDLSTHLAAMLTRVRYQINTKNPLLSDIKQYYPFAYDVTLSAMANVEDKLPYTISEDELGYLAVHIGVGLERNYNVGYTRHPHVLVVTDSGNSTIRMIEAKIVREFPQLKLHRVIALHEYEELDSVEEDFVITTVRLTEKNKPIVKIAPFPTPYQLEQVGRLAMVDRTKPYILERFFDERHFMIVKGKMTQETLFKRVCKKLEADGYITKDFYPSLVERESIVSTLLGEGIALPHSLGLLANKTVVVTILAPNGIEWNKEKKETANVIFLLAISKAEYEEAMAIYDLFVTFVREKATKRLLNSKSFNDFQVIAKDSLGRSA
ncbi:BglG family transcription antiterminator [Pragia fontium]|uniref:BglG family transcription antiterminator n=1 Tax=Pragia fontium TaxID=82985 RepID=UPI000F70609C|nr:PRD domain-containing protein [Pragia fontium]VEJ55132.1 Probable licABCH operon regulator [Pragia fontium]